MHPCEETKTANANVAPEVIHLQVREAQLSTKVSSLTSQETELHGQLQNQRQENTRINALMNKIRIASESMNNKKTGLAQQLQTSKFELSCAQTEVSHLRSSVERNQSAETRDAEDPQSSREHHLALARDNPGHSAEIDRLILNLEAAELETARIRSMGRRAEFYEQLESR